MRLNVNRLFVRRGTVIEISWDASSMSIPELVLTISGKENVMQIEPVGRKMIRIGGNSFKNSVTLRAYDAGGTLRTVRRTFYAWGKIKEHYDSYTRISPLNKYVAFVKDFWHRFPREKQRLYIILVLLMTSLIFVSSNQEVARIAILSTMGYVLYLMFKR